MGCLNSKTFLSKFIYTDTPIEQIRPIISMHWAHIFAAVFSFITMLLIMILVSEKEVMSHFKLNA